MNQHIQRLRQQIAPLREQITNHKVYSAINDAEDLKLFMQYHVYAVWDFMSLLKALQNKLTCTSVPWFPTGNADTRFLINEIVAGEESDIDQDGNRKSHFELYLDAMQQCGADTRSITVFTNTLQQTGNFEQAFQQSNTPDAAKAFVNFTFEVINSDKAWLQAATFTFGREDLIPGMFVSLVNDIYKRLPESISIFKYYLERHIEVDGDHHSHLALEMTAQLCGESAAYWQEAAEITVQSLLQRIALWDGAYDAIIKKQQAKPVATV